MSETDFFRQPLAEMIDPHHPLAMLTSRLPWAQIEAALAPRFARQVREGRSGAQDHLFEPSVQVAGAAVAAAGRPRLPLRLMASLLYLRRAYEFSDEKLTERWAENVVFQHSVACGSTSDACLAMPRRSGLSHGHR